MNQIARTKRIARLLLPALLLAVLALPLAGCDTAVPPAPAFGALAVGTDLVPDMPLDVYAVIEQPQATLVPRELLGLPDDLSVVSLAMWGVATDTGFSWGGALTLLSREEAVRTVAAVPAEAGVWTKLDGPTVFFVKLGTPAAADMQAAISDGRLVSYAFQEGIDALSFLPDGGATLALGAAAAVPSDALVKLITRDATDDVKKLVTALTKSSGLQVVAAGLYAAAPVDIRAIAADPALTAILSLDAGLLITVKSSWPGFIIDWLAGSAIGGAGYEKATLGDREVFRGTLDAGGGVRVPVVILVSGNRIFAAVSGRESYAEDLIAGIRSP